MTLVGPTPGVSCDTHDALHSWWKWDGWEGLYWPGMSRLQQHVGEACLQVLVEPLIGLGSLGLCCSCLTLEAELLHAAPQLVYHAVPLLQH